MLGIVEEAAVLLEEVAISACQDLGLERDAHHAIIEPANLFSPLFDICLIMRKIALFAGRMLPEPSVKLVRIHGDTGLPTMSDLVNAPCRFCHCLTDRESVSLTMPDEKPWGYELC